MQCFLKHEQDDQVSFLALIETMKKHELDDYGIPVVSSNSKGDRYKKIAVCDVTDIVECVGLVKYSSTKNKYKVVWPHALFHKKLDKKLVGKLTDL